MISVFANGALIYDSRLDDLQLLGLEITEVENKAGTASITMPPDHLYYTRFVGMRTIVEVYEDGDLIFRGRALYPTDDFYRRRTITCEGERGFFNDGVHRPYAYNAPPSEIFSTVIGLYNAEVDEEKRFTVGTVEVANNTAIILESEDAESFNETLDRLIELRGGYITFSTNADGTRAVNWVISYGRSVNQRIEIGENLTDYAGTDETLDVATVLVPFGALDDETGRRMTIASVNGGLDYIVDETAKDYRGSIVKAVVFDDVTNADLLLLRAREHLAKVKNVVTSLQLSAVDLSAIDKSLATFRVGDSVRVVSEPHGLDEDFRVTERTRDMLDPAGGMISLGKVRATLTGLDVEGDKNVIKIINNVRKEYKVNLENAIRQSEVTMSSLIQQTSEQIFLEVSEIYVTGEEVDTKIATVELTVDGLETRVQNAEGRVSALSQTVSGFDARIENAEGEVTLLSATVDGLATRVSDAEGNISNLSLTASSLASRITNAEGDISTLEQTATLISARVGQNEIAISNLGIQMTGYVTFANLSTAGQTVINGGNIAAGGTISGVTLQGCTLQSVNGITKIVLSNNMMNFQLGSLTYGQLIITDDGRFKITGANGYITTLYCGTTNPQVQIGNYYYDIIHAGNISNYINNIYAVFG